MKGKTNPSIEGGLIALQLGRISSLKFP